MAKKATKKKTTKKKESQTDIVAMKVEDMKVMEEAINLLARLAANPPRNQKEMDAALHDLNNNDIAMEAFRIQLGA